ncbi:hypothetical protein [Paludisphaera soli]|uniref:hypothetical protein n=1 Tax=Paludisphaera soli TaxID=2712865 RepID=UPI0013EA9AE2|nr:hypothetical protein [Paludisphaera soli]
MRAFSGSHGRPRIRLLTLAFGLLAAWGVARGDDDPILAKLETAQVDFEARIAKARESLLKRFDEAIEGRRKLGKLDELTAVQAARDAFELERTLPDPNEALGQALARGGRQYQSGRDKARKRLQNAYEAAVAALTRADRRDDARRIRDELDALAEEWAADAPKRDFEAIDPRGRPRNFQPGKVAAIAVWAEKDPNDGRWTWRIRMTPLVKDRVISGTIAVDGGTIEGYQLCGIGKGRFADNAWQPDPSTLRFDVRLPKGSEDGLDFRVAGRDAVLTIEARNGNGEGGAKAFLIGSQGTNPGRHPFRLSNAIPAGAGR